MKCNTMLNLKDISIASTLTLFSFLSIYFVWLDFHHISNFRAFGKTINAEVRYKYQPSIRHRGGYGRKINENLKSWEIIYYYKPSSRIKEYRGNVHVDKATYDQYSIGSTIQVTYNKNEPHISYAGDLIDISSSEILSSTRLSIFFPFILVLITSFYMIYILYFRSLLRNLINKN